MPKPLTKFKRSFTAISRLLQMEYLVRRHGADLELISDRTKTIQKNDLLAFVPARNEGIRLAYFLDFYRAQGVQHFLFIDNGSTDDSVDFLKKQKDCSIWYTEASYRNSNFAVYWLNYLLRRYGSGHWCLTLDPDEFLIIPYAETRTIEDLTRFLDEERRHSFFSIMLDMYSRGPVNEANYQRGQDPLEVCDWFDPTGYDQIINKRYQDCWVQGGVRRRLYFQENPHQAPSLNKTTLVRWKPHYYYVSSTHSLSPIRLNRAHYRDATLAPTGCLLHFKYLSLFQEKVAEELKRGQHYAGSREYKKYQQGLDKNEALWCPASTQYQGWEQLVDLGLMNTGSWF